MGRAPLPIVGGMHIPFAIPECRVDSFLEQEDPDRLVIRVRRGGTSGLRPDCGDASRSVHSRYRRHPGNLYASDEGRLADDGRAVDLTGLRLA